jgi:large subunit ribosomal protein L5e
VLSQIMTGGHSELCWIFSNEDVVARIIYATLAGDVVMAAAYSRELPPYGLKVGLTNNAAAKAGVISKKRDLLVTYA